MQNELHQSNHTARGKLIESINTMLGGNMVGVELTPADFNMAIDLALAKYRQRSENSVEESFVFLELEQHKNDYILPNEIIDVRQIYRRSFGVGSNGTDFVDPFELAYVNQYLLYPNSGGTFDIATYDLYAQNLELMGTMFGAHYNFVWNSMTHRLKISRNITGEKEEIMLWCYKYIPEYLLINDTYAGIWLTKWALTEAKLMLGAAYRKFSSGFAGAQGSVTLDSSMIQEASQEQQELILDLKNYVDSSMPLGFIMG